MSLKILVIDDSQAILEMLTFLLKTNSHLPFSVNNGQEALVMAKSEKFDLVISDLEMPDMNGIEFGLEFRKYNIRTPIIFYSSHDRYSQYQKDLSKIENNVLIENKKTKSLLDAIETFINGQLFPQ